MSLARLREFLEDFLKAPAIRLRHARRTCDELPSSRSASAPASTSSTTAAATSAHTPAHASTPRHSSARNSRLRERTERCPSRLPFGYLLTHYLAYSRRHRWPPADTAVTRRPAFSHCPGKLPTGLVPAKLVIQLGQNFVNVLYLLFDLSLIHHRFPRPSFRPLLADACLPATFHPATAILAQFRSNLSISRCSGTAS